MRRVGLIAVVLIVCARPAAAQDKAAADTVFDEGRTLMQQGKYAEACAKFEASLTILPQLGVRLNLGECYEKVGRTASAWSTFRMAQSMAYRANDARAAYATERMKALEPKLSRLRIIVPSPVRGLEVRRDGGIVPAAMYGTAVPTDPGEREVVATAEGHEEWRQTITVPAESGQVEVTIPALARVKTPEAPLPVDAGTDPGKPRRLIGLTVGAGGVVLVGVAVVFGLGAKGAWSDAKDLGCDDDGLCPTQAALDRLDSARQKAVLSTVFGVAGVAALGTGVVLYLTAPRKRAAVTLAPHVGGDYVGVTVRGGF